MNQTNFAVYMFFKGQCREAMEFYKGIFGGETKFQTYGEVKMDGGDENRAKLIMHAVLEGGMVPLMGSDTDQASDKAAKISLSVMGPDEAKLTGIFQQLSEGGDVQSPLKKEFWGDTFGTVVDKFGIEWMVNINQGPAGESASPVAQE